MKDIENEKTETTASDSTMPQINPIEDQRKRALEHYDEISHKAHHWSSFVHHAILAYNPQPSEQKPTEKDVSKGAEDEIKEIYEKYSTCNCRVCQTEVIKIAQEYSSTQKQQEREKTITNPNDVAYTMHQLIMLVNYLEDLGIKAKWEGEFWVVEQSGILLKFLDWFDGDLKVLKDHESLIHEYFTEKLKTP